MSHIGVTRESSSPVLRITTSGAVHIRFQIGLSNCQHSWCRSDNFSEALLSHEHKQYGLHTLLHTTAAGEGVMSPRTVGVVPKCAGAS